MAEAFVNHLCSEHFEAESAGLEPGTLSPLAVEAMAEAGIDIAGKATRAVFDVYRAGRAFAYIVTVCDEASAERCPVYPGKAERLHWSFPDPSAPTGTHQERLARVREIRGEIRARVEALCAMFCETALA